MNKTLTKIKPADNDSMPREVALSMLTNPKNKLTGNFRRACMRALEIVFPSEQQPFLREMEGYVVDDSIQPVDGAVKLDRKLRRKTIFQLYALKKKSVRRKSTMGFLRTKLERQTPSLMVTQLLAQVNANLVSHGFMMDRVTEELKRRGVKYD